VTLVPGDHVTTIVANPSEHTRLPRYLRGKPGIVVAVRGAFPLADLRAQGIASEPEMLYTVCFDAADVWGLDAEPNETLLADLWESYLVAR
jgi:nitrile hydratase subunit beta